MKISTLTFIALLTTTSATFANANQFGDGTLENTFISGQTVAVNQIPSKVVQAVSGRNHFGDGSFDNVYITGSADVYKNTISSVVYNPLYASRNSFGDGSPAE